MARTISDREVCVCLCDSSTTLNWNDSATTAIIDLLPFDAPDPRKFVGYLLVTDGSSCHGFSFDVFFVVLQAFFAGGRKLKALSCLPYDDSCYKVGFRTTVFLLLQTL